MNRKEVKLALSFLSGVGSVGLTNIIVRSSNKKPGVFTNAGILVFESVIFMHVTAFTFETIGTISEVYEKFIEKMKEDKEEKKETEEDEKGE